MGKQTNPRFITAAEDLARNSNVSVIDLGVIGSATMADTGGMQELLPYRAGQFITGIRYLPDGWINPDFLDLVFLSPRTNFNSLGGWGFIADGAAYDTIGQYINSSGLEPNGFGSQNAMVLDTGPLVAMRMNPDNYYNHTVWAADTLFAQSDIIIDTNNHAQVVTGGGLSGNTAPTWDTSGGVTSDGTVQWTDLGLSVGAVHVLVEVIDIPGLTIPRPTTLEFVQQPTDTAQSGTITPAVTVKVLDQFGAAFIGVDNVHIRLDMPGGGVANLNDVIVDKATGIATLDSLSPDTVMSGAVLRTICNSVGIPSINSDPFDVTAP